MEIKIERKVQRNHLFLPKFAIYNPGKSLIIAIFEEHGIAFEICQIINKRFEQHLEIVDITES